MDKQQFTTEDELFEDDAITPGDIPDGELPNSEAAAGEAELPVAPPAGPPAGPPADILPADVAPIAPAAEEIQLPDLSGVELTGVERFLSTYGVKGGMIEFDEGEAVHFDSLSSDEQANVLGSLTKKSIPTADQLYDLAEGEINLLNQYRASGSEDISEFLNNAMDQRLSTILKDEKYASVNYDELDSDSIFIYHTKENNPDMTDEALADELVKAKELSTFESTTDALRNGLKHSQTDYIKSVTDNEEAEFAQEIESQRQEVVDAVYNINEVAGSVVTDEMKDYLLADIMELNDNKDPVLMEKIFSTPEAMFKANWFLNYGESHINSINEYWKKEVSKARKAGYQESVRNMPRNATVGASSIPRQVIKHTAASMAAADDIISEEELFEQK